MRLIKTLATLILAVIVLSGCTPDEKELTAVTEDLENIKWMGDTDDSASDDEQIYHITTATRSFTAQTENYPGYAVFLYGASEKDTVTYYVDDNAVIQKVKIYLAPDSIKTYSKRYTEKYQENMPIVFDDSPGEP